MKKSIGKRLRSLFFSNWLLKIASLIIAFALWFFVASINDPVDEKKLPNVRVTLLNTEVLENNNQIYEILDNTDVLKSVTFDAPKSIRDQIQVTDIIAEADLENLTVTNTVAIKFSCPKFNGQVQNISGNIEYVKLNIENKEKKWFDIKSNLIGEVAEGYVVGGVTLNQNRIEVQGPESAIRQIRKAYVDINVADISNSISSTVNIHLVDANGTEVTRASVTKNISTVVAVVEVLGTKNVPIEFDYSGVPAEGHKVTGNPIIDPISVMVAGDEKALKNFDKITIPPEAIDISDSTNDFQTQLNIQEYLPSNIRLADPGYDGTATVSISVERIIEKSFDLNIEDIEMINVPEGLVCTIAEESAPVLRVKGLNAYIELIHEPIHGTVDLAEWMETKGLTKLLPGTYTVPVKVALLAQQQIVSSPEVSIIVTDPLE